MGPKKKRGGRGNQVMWRDFTRWGLSVLLPSGSGGVIPLPPPVPSFSFFLASRHREVKAIITYLSNYIHTHLSGDSQTHTECMWMHNVSAEGGGGGGWGGGLTEERGGKKMEAVKYRELSVSVFFLLGTKPEEVNNWPQIENTLPLVGRHLG